MTCIKDTQKLQKMSLGYLNSIFNRSSSIHSDIRNHPNKDDDEQEEDEKSRGDAPKSGLFSNLKRNFNRKVREVRSKYKSKLRKSKSMIERPCDLASANASHSSNTVDTVYEEPGSSREAEFEPDSNEPRTLSLTVQLLQLSKYGWYWGPITREEADEKLAGQPEGSFLVRDSSNDHFLLSVSFRCSGRTFHSRIFHSGGKFSFYPTPDADGHNSIPELVEHSMNSSQRTVFCYSRPRSPGHPSFPVRLTKPVSRITHVRSLQYLCRFVIRQYTRVDQIKDLPLPSSLCDYIEEGQF